MDIFIGKRPPKCDKCGHIHWWMWPGNKLKCKNCKNEIEGYEWGIW